MSRENNALDPLVRRNLRLRVESASSNQPPSDEGLLDFRHVAVVVCPGDVVLELPERVCPGFQDGPDFLETLNGRHAVMIGEDVAHKCAKIHHFLGDCVSFGAQADVLWYAGHA